MKLLNWAKEKIKTAGQFLGIGLDAAPRFNKTVNSAVMPPDRKRRSQVRKAWRLQRWSSMPTQRGCPVLTGMRLENTRRSMDKSNLLVLPKSPEWHNMIEARRETA